MKWLLILLVVAGGQRSSVSVSPIDTYRTRELCQLAGEALKARFEQDVGFTQGSITVKFSCLANHIEEPRG